ncbi:peptidase inhibitor family I36 protein [Streptomyces caeruleatus]|uniref:peptidase inhibitor family I36 protein n=1 Tax=Streptomyces caeruleatus TaxID=661399 RepID=UPI00099EDA00|nr:peptidase inhibitor family I36 protein [Streptomyces caeruleatus]
MADSRKLAVAFAATAAILTLGSVPAQAAQESTAASTRVVNCATGRMCMYEDASYTGSKYVNWKPTGTNQKYQIDGWNGDNEITSLINNTSYNIRLYDNDDYSGRSMCVVKNSSINNLKNWWIFNDKAESAKTVANC